MKVLKLFAPLAKGPTLKIAIIRTSSIGDVVLATSCLNLLSKLKMPTQVIWIGKQPALGLLENAFPKIEFVLAEKLESGIGEDETAKHLADVHLIIDLQKNIRSRLICSAIAKASGAPHFTWDREGLKRSRLIMQSRLLGRSQTLSDKYRQAEHLKYQKMLEPLRQALIHHLPEEMRDGIDGDFPPHLPTEHDQGSRPWQKELKFGKWLAVAPGASYPTKRAPINVFSGILSDFLHQWSAQNTGSDKVGVGLLFLGDNEDRRFSLELTSMLSWPSATLNLAGKLSLWETALALKEAKVLLANDTSLGHIAEAVGTPTAVLFGPTVEAFGFGPRMAQSQAFSSDLGCRPCSKHGKSECRFNDQLCFTSIKPSPVASHLLGLFS